jgi:xanthine dehydrogenase YagS FAD-binding subunit
VVTMSAASPVVRRSQEAEAVLTGKTITPELARAAGQASMHGAMPLSMNAYKVQLFPVAIYRTVLLAAGQMGRDPSAAS